MRFQLVRYFTITSLVAFVIVTAALTFFYRNSAINDLLKLQESKNVALTITFANSLWDEFRGFVDASRGKNKDELQTAPRLPQLRAAVLDLMAGLTVAKVKVFNLDGMTVFSTEASQIGTDKSTNGGFVSARGGLPASELTHRDTFSAFESVIEDRDVISSYIPIYNARNGQMEGVFEVYDDVTPFLAQINRTQWWLAGGVVLLLGLLFAALLIIVRRADATIKSQQRQKADAEAQLFQSEKMASLGQMVAGVSHELNTPLGYTRSNVDMCLEILAGFTVLFEEKSATETQPLAEASALPHPQDLEQVRELLSYSLKGLDEMSELVVNLKNFARLDLSKTSKTNVNDLLENVLRISNHMIKGRINVAKILGNVPDIQCMPSQINQVFLNLITNAAQAIEGKGRMWIRTQVKADALEVIVLDDGRGMEPDELRKIFEPFYTTKDVGSGTGLGLSIALKIVQQHGGKISVKSKVGVGTQFTLLFPMSQSKGNFRQAA